MQQWSQRWLQDSSSRCSQLNEGVTCTLIFAHLFTLSIHTSLLYVFTWQAWHWIAPLFHIISASPRMRETHRTNYEMLHPRFGASRQYSSSWSKFSRIWSNSTWRFSRSARCSITRANSSCTALSSSCVVCQSLTKSCSFHKEMRFWQVPNASMYRFEISSRVSPLTVAALASLFGSRFKWLKSPKRLRPGAPAHASCKNAKIAWRCVEYGHGVTYTPHGEPLLGPYFGYYRVSYILAHDTCHAFVPIVYNCHVRFQNEIRGLPTREYYA